MFGKCILNSCCQNCAKLTEQYQRKSFFFRETADFGRNVNKLGLHHQCFLEVLKLFSQPSEAATRGVLWKKVFLEISRNSQENTCVRVSFLINFLEISKNTFFTEHLWTTTSEPCVYKTCLLNHLFEFAPKFPWPPFLMQIYLTFTEILPLPKKLKKLILNFITWITGAVAWGCSIYSRCPEKFLKLKGI